MPRGIGRRNIGLTMVSNQKLAGSMEKEAMCSTAKEQMQDGNIHEAMGKSDMPPSQCMPESGNTAKQS